MNPGRTLDGASERLARFGLYSISDFDFLASLGILVSSGLAARLREDAKPTRVTFPPFFFKALVTESKCQRTFSQT